MVQCQRTQLDLMASPKRYLFPAGIAPQSPCNGPASPSGRGHVLDLQRRDVRWRSQGGPPRALRRVGAGPWSTSEPSR